MNRPHMESDGVHLVSACFTQTSVCSDVTWKQYFFHVCVVAAQQNGRHGPALYTGITLHRTWRHYRSWGETNLALFCTRHNFIS